MQNLDKFLSLNDLYRLGFASLSEPLSPRGEARESFLRFIRYIGKIPRILRPAVDTSVSLIRMRGVVRSTFPSRKTFALRKHLCPLSFFVSFSLPNARQYNHKARPKNLKRFAIY